MNMRKLTMLGAVRFLLLGTTVAVFPPTVQIAMAAPTASFNADGLLRNMHRSLATVLVGYKSSQGKPARGDALVLEAANLAASDLAGLEKAFKDRNARAVSNATERLAVSVGRLEAVAHSVSLRNPTVKEGVRAVSANWAAYTARYTLARNQRQSVATTKQVDALKAEVNRLNRKVKNLRQRVAANETLAHDVDDLIAQVDLIERRGVTVETYQETLLVLTSFRGWVGGYTIITPVYYPEYRHHFVVFEPEVVFVGGYWDGYYDAYYENVPWAYYGDRFDSPETVNINVDVTVQQDIDVYVNQDITVVIEETASAEADLTRIDAQSSDVIDKADQPELLSAATEAVTLHDTVAPATIAAEPGEIAPAETEKTQTEEMPDGGPVNGEEAIDDTSDATKAAPVQSDATVRSDPDVELTAKSESGQELKASPKDEVNDEAESVDETEPAKAASDAEIVTPRPSDEAGFGEVGEVIKPKAETAPDGGPVNGEEAIDDTSDATKAAPVQSNESIRSDPDVEPTAASEFKRELDASPKDGLNDEAESVDEIGTAKAASDAEIARPQQSDETRTLESEPERASRATEETPPEEANADKPARETGQSCEGEACG